MSAPDDPKVVKLRAKRPAEPEESWYGRLLKSPSTGKVIDCAENVRLVVLGDPCFAGLIHYDELRARTVCGSMPWHTTDRLRPWVDRDDVDLACWCQRHGLIVKPSTAAQAVQSVAAAHPVHPLRDRLNALVWDGVKRLDGWLTDYLGVEKSTYTSAVGRRWPIQAVNRVMVPGCKADYTLILEGIQGPGKSTVCEILALDQEWFTDSVSDLGTKDSAQDLAGKWIIELGELSAVSRSEVERVKAFLSRKFDHYRPSYGRHSQDFQRQCVFIGSTNATVYLTDNTGNRRYWPVRVGVVDFEALRRDVDQLWAEATAAYRDRELSYLNPDEESQAAHEQEKRVRADPWDDLVIEAAGIIHEGRAIKRRDREGYIVEEVFPSNVVTTNSVLQAINVPVERRSRAEETRVGAILVAAGWKVRQNRWPTVPRRYYEPPDVPTE